jgi:hypothetical protein
VPRRCDRAQAWKRRARGPALPDLTPPKESGRQDRTTRVSQPTGLSRQAIEGAARLSCIMRGCRCKPDLEVRHVAGITHTRILHDAWCPVVAGAA